MMLLASWRLLFSLCHVEHDTASFCMCIVHVERSVWVWCCGEQAGSIHVPDEQHVFNGSTICLSNVVLILALSPAIDHLLSSLMYEYMWWWEILGCAQEARPIAVSSMRNRWNGDFRDCFASRSDAKFAWSISPSHLLSPEGLRVWPWPLGYPDIFQ